MKQQKKTATGLKKNLQGFLKKENLRVLYDEKTIRSKIRLLGKQITNDFKNQELCVIGILKGSFIFMADLVRQLNLPITCDFIGISSYGDKVETSGVVQITRDLQKPIEGKNVLIVEDIIDTGLTMKYLIENLTTRLPKCIKICSLLHKPSNTRMQVPIDYLGFTIPNSFVVGYGLDFADRYRNLPFIGIYDANSK